MKKVKRTALFILFALFFLTSSVFGQAQKISPASTNPVKIGGSLPLTGIYSEQAKWVKEAFDFWVEDINNRGGLLNRPVKMTIYNDESSADKAVTYYERAITVDKVDLVIGTVGPTNVVALMPLVEKYHKVFITMGGMMKSFEQGFTYSFASPPSMSDWIHIAFNGILDELIPKAEWPKSIAILTANNVGGVSGRLDMIQFVKDRGIGVVVDETYNLPLNDATPLISKTKGRGAEWLACMSFFDDGVMLMRAAKSMNYSPKLMSQMFASNIPAWTTELGADGDNVIMAHWWNYRLPFPGNDKINAVAKTKFGLPGGPTQFGFGYSWMKTLELAVQGARTLDNEKIRDYLRSNKFDLPYGKGITFDKKGLPSPFAFGLQTTNRSVEIVWPKDIATTKLVYPRPPWRK